MKTLLFNILIIFSFASIVQAQTIYVDASATGTNNGTSWTNAYTSLQTALGVASSTSEIWVASGTYKPHASNRSIAFAIPSGVELYGGFAGTETMLTQRNPAANLTILSGDLNGNDNNTLLETEPTRNDNSYHIVSIVGNQTGVVIDGFTLTGANANGVQASTSASNSYSTKRGGALYVDKTSAGGSLTATVRNCVFEKNTASQGACYAHWNHWGATSIWMDVDFTSCVFRNNYSAEYGVVMLTGGATFNQGTRGEWVNNVFYDNTTASKGGVVYASGTIANRNYFVNNTFHNNLCTTATDGDVVYANGASSVQFQNNIFTGVTNEAFYITAAAPTISNNQIEGGATVGVNTIDYPAAYTNAAAADFSLTNQSYAVDAGNNAFLNALSGTYNVDFAGNTRTQHTEVDLGAFESNLNAPTITTTSSYTKNIQDADFAITATSNSTGAITYSIVTGSSVQLSGNMVTIVDTGMTTIDIAITAASGFSVGRKSVTVDVAVLRWYVDANATGAGTGFNWADAFTSIADAVNAPTDESSEIWVAAGTYKPTTGTDRTISMNLKDNHTLYGGFAGTETMLNQRNSTNNITVITGDLNGNDNNTILDTEASRSDNSYHLFIIKGEQQGIIIDGFTLTGVNANGAESNASPTNSYSNRRGGCIFVNADPNRTIEASVSNCIFEKNTATQGACYATWARNSAQGTWMDVDFTNCVFRNNYSVSYGVALIVASTNFDQKSRGDWVNNIFYDNTATSKSGAVGVFGGNSHNQSRFINNTFYNNVCTNGTDGDAVYSDNANAAKFQNNIFAGNTNAAFKVLNASSIIQNNLIEGTNYDLGTGNVHKAAAFVDAANADFSLTTQSYAVGAGNNSFLPSGYANDFAGNVRIQNTTIDMGAYESNLDGATLVYTNNYTKLMSDPDFALTATSNSSGAITYTIIDGVSVQLSGAMADIVDAGKSIVEVAVAGDATHNPAAGYITIDVTANNFFVDQNATGNNTGESWTNAFNKLEDALAATGQTEVWVAAGTYKPAVTARDSFYVIPTGFQLYGGFNGTETERDQRNSAVNRTILSGDLNGDDNATLSTTEPTRSDNSYHLIFIKGTQNNVVIDGFTLTGVNANGPSAHTSSSNSYSHKRGGAIYVDPAPTGSREINADIRNCLFEKNTAEESSCFTVWGRFSGSNTTANVNFERCIFRNNFSLKYGVFLATGSTTFNMKRQGHIANCLFYDNTSDEKGGVFYLSGTTACDYTIVNNTFYNNLCTNGVDGDAVNTNAASSVEFYNNIFYGMSNDIFTIAGASPTISSNLIQNGAAVGTGTITSDPMFVSVAGGNYSLSAASPALDQGVNSFLPSGLTTDLAGNARIQNTTIDLGAYEGMAVVSSVKSMNKATQKAVNVYPNPTRMGLTIEIDQPIEAVQIYTMNGQLLKQLQGDQKQVNVAELPAGAYILEIQTSDALLHSRFVKE